MSAVGGGGGPRLRPLNVSSDLENRPAANNKTKSTKPLLKPQSQPKTDKTLKPTTPQAALETKDKAVPSPQSTPTNLVPSILSHQGSLNASCSSEASASSGSSSSRSSIGRVVPRRNTRISVQGKRQCGSKPNKSADDESAHADSSSDTRRRCAWHFFQPFMYAMLITRVN
ncbi:hypothetical protein RJ641_020244 [Dillenia turbinata]|uniref:Uncharacterized protein n=1 Tax=Dillenia turbinata TaxID=194707 RepID=A0AAN8UR35_9MAGN